MTIPSASSPDDEPLGPEWSAPDLMPYDDDPAAQRLDGVLGAAPIAYLGRAFSALEFPAYVRSLRFDELPGFVVLHHTAIPSTTWAPAGTGAVWDANEKGLTRDQRIAKRLRQLRAIFDWYEREKGWTSGPQLWVDDLAIYVGTPLTMPGIHAGKGNRVNGLYSIGIEVLGHYRATSWPAPVLHNVAVAVAALKQKLETFHLISRAGPGGIAEHRMFGKPECPGDAIQPAFYLPEFTAAYRRLTAANEQPPPWSGPPGTVPVDARFAEAYVLSGGLWQKGRLTPGYALAPAYERPDGSVVQRFERGIARLQNGEVSWMRLDEAVAEAVTRAESQYVASNPLRSDIAT